MNYPIAKSGENGAAASEQQSILAKFGLEALKAANISDLLQLASEMAAEGLKSGLAKILKYLPEEHKFLIVAGVGWSKDVVGKAKIEAGKNSAPGFAFHSGKPVLSVDLNAETRFKIPSLLRKNGVLSAVNVIIREGDKAWGVLEADSKETYAFTRENVDFLHGFSNILGIALSRFESEERFRMFVDFTYDWEYWIAPDGSYIYVSPACEKITGYEQEYFRDAGQLVEIAHPNDRELVEKHVEEHLHETSKYLELEYRIFNRKGEERWIAHACRPVYSKDGRYMGRRASNRDITERKSIEQQMALFVNLVDRSNDGISVVDLATGRIILVNEKFCRNLQFTREELLSMCPEDISTKPSGFFDRHFQELRKSGTFLGDDRHRRKDGTTFPVEVSVKHTKVNGREFAVAVIRDISERKRLERELRKAQKLESLGHLAGGIAHDFNNILTAILGNINLAQMYLPQGNKAADRLGIAEQASIRARGLAQQLLTFAKGGAPIKKTISVQHLVREAVDLAIAGSTVRGEYIFSNDLWPIEADEGQLNQAINNLALNAVKAMPEGGVLTVTAENESLLRGNNLGLQAGKYVRIAIKDQGGGIPAKDQENIFDPYFTTKEEGSGLGLSITFSIVKRHGGTITVESMLGKGSTFSILLPASKKRKVAPKAAELREVIAGTGRILIMDDEESVREVEAEMLRHLGYHVETVRDGAEAITAYQQALAAGRPYDVVITDLTVPAGMGGKETVQKLVEIDQQAKVIVASGYAHDPVISDYATYGFKGVIPKPFRLNDLSKTLQEVLVGKE
ncbi:MAG: PAS domain S-box protein [Deltaproteobacteria bacterium]